MNKVEFEIEELDEGFVIRYKSVGGRHCSCAIASPMQLQRKIFHLLAMQKKGRGIKKSNNHDHKSRQ